MLQGVTTGFSTTLGDGDRGKRRRGRRRSVLSRPTPRGGPGKRTMGHPAGRVPRRASSRLVLSQSRRW
jgi:hypothetical protein